MIINPQSQKIYQILLDSESALSAKDLATRLKIYPNTVYRLCEPLINFGLINPIDSYPTQFRAKPLNEGLSLFLLHQNTWFKNRFSDHHSFLKSPDIDFSFVQGRDELMRLSQTEIDHSHKSVDLLRSGHEIPAEIMLALINAKKRGVITRMLIQDFSPENIDQVAYWKQNGILVKKTNLIHIRLMLYDSQVAYFMSYKHGQSNKDMGMKVDYPPFAAILSQMFNQWWTKGQNT